MFFNFTKIKDEEKINSINKDESVNKEINEENAVIFFVFLRIKDEKDLILIS